MPLTNNMLAHLSNPTNKPYICTLIEIQRAGFSDVYRLGTLPYTSGGYVYDDLITSDIVFEAALDASNAVADFDIADDVRADWKEFDFTAADCRIKIGDTRWSLAAFELVAAQKVSHVKILGDYQFRVELSDQYIELLDSISTPLINDIQTPISLGVVKNAEAVLVYPLTRVYSIGFHVPLADIVVRDNGVVLTPGAKWVYDNTIPGAVGTNIKLVDNPAGRVTVDFIATNYRSLPVVLQYILVFAGIGMTVQQVRDRMIGFAAEWVKDDIKVSVWVREPKSVSGDDIIKAVIESSGIVMRRGEDGLPEFIYLDYTNINVMPLALTIAPDMILLGGLTEIGRDPAYSSIRIKYSANRTTQNADELAGSVAPADKELFLREYWDELTVDVISSAGVSGTLEKLTHLESGTREASRLEHKHRVQRRRWSCSIYGAAMGLRPGYVVSCVDDMLPFPELGDPRFFVSEVRHNLSTLVSDVVIMDGNLDV